MRDRLDIDYAHKLDPKTRAWLANALDMIHGADFRRRGATQDKDFRRAMYREKNAANRDLWGKRIRDDAAPEALPTMDPDRVPGYLSSPRYKKALARFRSLHRFRDAEEWEKARKALARIIKAGK